MPAAAAFGDHEPPMPAPLPPPHAPPPSASTVANVACHMATAKKSRKKTYLTPDEALDRLLAEQERKKGKAAKKAVATQDRAKLAIRDRATLAIRDRDEEELETQPPVAKPKIAPVVSTGLVKKKLKTKTAAGASGSQRRKKYA